MIIRINLLTYIALVGNNGFVGPDGNVWYSKPKYFFTRGGAAKALARYYAINRK